MTPIADALEPLVEPKPPRALSPEHLAPRPAIAQPCHNEILKDSDPTLGGTIAQTLANPQADRFSEDDNQFLKFHGLYQQDDRDLRKTGKKYMVMVRVRVPGGVLTPQQYLVCDELADGYADHTLRVTSRQAIQFHGVVKAGLGRVVKGINDALLTTLAACGDNNRNVMAPPAPATSGLGAQVQALTESIALALAPRTPAYHSIWIDGAGLNLEDPAHRGFVDPLYGKTYLPRKFKIAFAVPPLNDVDILTNCLGFVAIADGDGRLLGFNLTAGGGMGRSHGNEATFPRLADVIGFLPADKVVDAARAVLTIHRDFGDRTNRKRARLKYVLAERGPGWFRQELERRLGFELEAPRPFKFERQGDAFGWHRQVDGRVFLGLFVETGRIRDREGYRLKTALREVIARFQPEVRLTPANNVLLANLRAEDQAAVAALFAAHGVDLNRQGTRLRRASMACVALPTCGLALAEAERYLPRLIGDLDALTGELGLGDQEIAIRMTGCPNGCARPYMAEIGFVGKAPGKYQIYLGGNETCTRLNRLWKETVKDTEIVSELRVVLGRYARERAPGERFGDFAARVLWPEQAVPRAV
jgi:sulfite reductase (NADPH) hemoprotein beta-component